jgi:PhnB protein
MSNNVNPIPKGFRSVNLHLSFQESGKAIEFYKAAFGAVELYRLTEPDGKIGHAELQIGDSIVMLGDEYPEYGAVSPLTLGGAGVRLSLFVPDCDTIFAQAVAAGATVMQEVKTHSYGERSGNIKDPFGYVWMIGTHVEDVSPEEMQQRYTEELTE